MPSLLKALREAHRSSQGRFQVDDTPTIILVHEAMAIKPKFGEPCNNCGYCCLEEVCTIGIELTESNVAPCLLLVQKEGKHYCSLANIKMYRDALGIGTYCCSETQKEILNKLRAEP